MPETATSEFARSESVQFESVEFDTVLFDVDGTLIDSTYHHAVAWSRAFARFDLHPPLWRVHRSIGMGGDQLVPAVCGDEVEEAHGEKLRELWGEEYERLIDEVRAFEGAADTVRAMRERGFRVALASSGKKEFTDKALEMLGISRDDVDAVTSSDDADASKPEPDILQAALEQAGGSQGILIGDATWDIVSARRAGMPCVSVRTGGFSGCELDAEGAVSVVDSVGELREHKLFAARPA